MERLPFKLQSCGINSSLSNSFKIELISQKMLNHSVSFAIASCFYCFYVRRCNQIIVDLVDSLKTHKSHVAVGHKYLKN